MRLEYARLNDAKTIKAYPEAHLVCTERIVGFSANANGRSRSQLITADELHLMKIVVHDTPINNREHGFQLLDLFVRHSLGIEVIVA